MEPGGLVAELPYRLVYPGALPAPGRRKFLLRQGLEGSIRRSWKATTSAMCVWLPRSSRLNASHES